MFNLKVASRSFSTDRARDDTRKWSRILWLYSIYGEDDDIDDYDAHDDAHDDDADDDEDLTWCNCFMTH